MRRTQTVGIVWGGPGGLLTAYFLEKLANRPLRVTVFESSPRLGGKILSPHFQAAPVRYEAGAAEFYDYSALGDDPLKELIAELGLPITPMGGPAVIMNHRILSNLDDVRDQLGAAACTALQQFDRFAKDWVTPQEYYEADYPEGAYQEPDRRRFDALLASVREPRARQYVENLIHSDLATEPQGTSPSYGMQNYVMNDPAYMQLYGIDGGNERLPRELAARISAEIRLERRVVSVGQSANGRMRVTSIHEGQTHLDDFDFVVIALPHNCLPAVEFQGERLAAAVELHYAHYNHPAHYLRITLLFERPFWRAQLTDSFWMLDRFGGCCLYDESSRDPSCTHGVLGWLLGGQSACELSRRSDPELIKEALDSLPDFLAAGKDCLLEGRVHRWLGAVNAIPGGIVAESHDRRHQPEPVEHFNLFFVGDYLYDSTLNGVLDSAEYVSAWIAGRVADSHDNTAGREIHDR